MYQAHTLMYMYHLIDDQVQYHHSVFVVAKNTLSRSDVVKVLDRHHVFYLYLQSIVFTFSCDNIQLISTVGTIGSIDTNKMIDLNDKNNSKND
jgi:hypothetical protein